MVLCHEWACAKVLCHECACDLGDVPFDAVDRTAAAAYVGVLAGSPLLLLSQLA